MCTPPPRSPSPKAARFVLVFGWITICLSLLGTIGVILWALRQHGLGQGLLLFFAVPSLAIIGPAVGVLEVIGSGGGPSCGGCRQLLREYCPAAMPVVFVSETAIVRETTVGAMLPDAFVLAS